MTVLRSRAVTFSIVPKLFHEGLHVRSEARLFGIVIKCPFFLWCQSCANAWPHFYLLPMYKKTAHNLGEIEKSRIKSWLNPPILGLRALPATAPSVFVKIRSPNDGPRSSWSSPWSEKPAKVTTSNLLLTNFDQNIKFIHSLGSGLLFWVGTHKQQLLMPASGGNRALTTKSGTRQGEQQQQ